MRHDHFFTEENKLAKIPQSLLKGPERTLADLQVNETAYMGVWDLWVSSDLECWLSPDAKIYRRPSGLKGSLRVMRKEDGYHVALLTHETFEPKPLPPGNDYLPVASLIEAYDPQLDFLFRFKHPD